MVNLIDRDFGSRRRDVGVGGGMGRGGWLAWATGCELQGLGTHCRILKEGREEGGGRCWELWKVVCGGLPPE